MHRFHLVWIAVGGLLMLAMPAAQQAGPARVIGWTGLPLVAQLQPRDTYVVFNHPSSPPSTRMPDKPFVEHAVEQFPIIASIRVLAKDPVLRRRNWQGESDAPLPEANWIGSRFEARIDRLIKASAALPLEEGDLVRFYKDWDARTIIRGVRVETVTPWLRPIEVGRRYLVLADVNDGQFDPVGVFEDPATGGELRPMRIGMPRRSEISSETLRSSDGQVLRSEAPPNPLAPWSLDQALFLLQQEVAKRRQPRP